jgi:hypothetical protein
MLQQVGMDRGMSEAEPEGRWFQLIEDQSHYSGLLTLQGFDLAMLLRRHGFQPPLP